MARTITLTIPVEVRPPRSKEDVRDARIKVWTGADWKYLSWTPISPALAAITKARPGSYRVKLRFMPLGVTPIDQLCYQRSLLVSMRKQGVVR